MRRKSWWLIRRTLSQMLNYHATILITHGVFRRLLYVSTCMLELVRKLFMVDCLFFYFSLRNQIFCRYFNYDGCWEHKDVARCGSERGATDNESRDGIWEIAQIWGRSGSIRRRHSGGKVNLTQSFRPKYQHVTKRFLRCQRRTISSATKFLPIVTHEFK